MEKFKYEIFLTDGTLTDGYYKWADTQEKAIILAQEEAMKFNKGIQLVSAKQVI